MNHAMHRLGGPGDRNKIKSKRVTSKAESHSFSKGGRGSRSILTGSNPNNQVGNGTGMFVPTGSQSKVTADITYYDDGTVDVNMTTEVSRMNTTGDYIANYDIIDINGKKIQSDFLVNKSYGIKRRFNFDVFIPKSNSSTVLSTATFRNIPLNSMMKVNIGLKFQMAAGASSVIPTYHIIKIN